MPRPLADHAVLENVFDAIDKLTLALHVADFPKTRQTRPTSPPTPRPTTGSSSQSCRRRFPTRRHAPKNRILTRNAPRPAREFLVEGRDTGRGGRGAARSAAGDAQDFSKAKIPQIVVNCAEVRALNPR
ncbi:hypothetical protein EV121DRAFT_297708 [Schizophyllum commune]